MAGGGLIQPSDLANLAGGGDVAAVAGAADVNSITPVGGMGGMGWAAWAGYAGGLAGDTVSLDVDGTELGREHHPGGATSAATAPHKWLTGAAPSAGCADAAMPGMPVRELGGVRPGCPGATASSPSSCRRRRPSRPPA